MWALYAFASALFAGLTAILAKCGIQKTDSNVATALRTGVVLVFAWAIVFATGAQRGLADISGRTLTFLVLSGLATGASWLCYFRALQLGSVNQVVPVDKSSIILTVLLAFLCLGEPVSAWKLAGLAGIAAGTYLMIRKQDAATGQASQRGWFLFAALSAVFASLTSILGKLGISGVDANLGTALRTGVVLVMAWVVVFATGGQCRLHQTPPRELAFLCLSGLATGASWLCYYRALQEGPASAVVPIDKLSILVTVAFSRIVLGERLSRRAALGLALLTAGTLLMLK